MTKSEWRRRLMEAHPDRGGDPAAFIALLQERDRELKAAGITCWQCGKHIPPERMSHERQKYCSPWCANRANSRRRRKPRRLKAKPSRRQWNLSKTEQHRLIRLEIQMQNLDKRRQEVGMELFKLRFKNRFGVMLAALMLILGAAPAWAQPEAPAVTPTTAYDEASAMVIRLGAEQASVPRFLVGQQVRVCWDLAQSDQDQWQVTRAEARVNGTEQNFSNTGNPPVVGESSSFCTNRWDVPSQAVGTHTVYVRWCNAAACGPAVSGEFIVDPLVPGVPRNFRIEPPQPIAVNLPQAVELASSYAYIARLGLVPTGAERPTMAELTYLATTYTGPLEKNAILRFLDSEAAKIAGR